MQNLRFRYLLSTLALLVIGTLFVPMSFAASSWNPTLLVNTESFEVIDAGDGTTNIELRFGDTLDARILYDRTNGRFKLTKPLFIQGNLTVTGSTFLQGAVTATGAITTKSALSGASLHTSGNANVRGTLTASGSVRTDGDLTINDDAGATDATLTFGNATANQTVKFNHANQRFEFSKDLKVNGSISGSTLTVDGNITVKNVTYSFPGSQGAANTYLKNDGAGNLTWTTTSVGDGSGGILGLSPVYPSATYFSSGALYIGQLSNAYDTTNKQNYYRWTSTKGTLQNYWIATRVRLPNNFSSWDPVAPIQFRYRTASGDTGTNNVTLRILDTGNAHVALTGGNQIANTSWTTATITGPQSAGTFTAGGYITILVKLETTSGGSADAGYIQLNMETTTP